MICKWENQQTLYLEQTEVRPRSLQIFNKLIWEQVKNPEEYRHKRTHESYPEKQKYKRTTFQAKSCSEID